MPNVEYIVVMRKDNIYAIARFDSEREAERVTTALTNKGHHARMLVRAT